MGPQGPPGPQGPAGASGTAVVVDGGSPLRCVPGSWFCEGSRLWQCTRSGSDAIGGTRCPAGCVTTGCPEGQSACCAPACTTNLTVGGWPVELTSCFPPSIPDASITCNPTFVAVVYFPKPSVFACGGDSYLLLQAHRPVPTGSLNLADAGILLGLGGFNCGKWTGAVSIVEPPAWSVTLNATCSGAGDGGVTVVGSFGSP